jgi:leader peptidase (prepilin peptidase) / N-methyltransferase
MRETFIPALVLAAGMAAGPALTAYAGWIVRCRRGELAGEGKGQNWMAASLVNGLGWLLAWAASPGTMEAVDLGLTISAAIILTIIDIRIRVIPNELVAALLCLWVALSLMEQGLAALPGRLAGLLTALALFALAVLVGGKGKKLGGGDVKLAAVAGFAAGFPGVLAAVLLMALAALMTGGAGMLLGRMGRKTPMPFAGFIMGGLAGAVFLGRVGALGFLGWQ